MSRPALYRPAWTSRPTVLPLGRRGRARTSLEGDLGHQIEQAESAVKKTIDAVIA